MVNTFISMAVEICLIGNLTPNNLSLSPAINSVIISEVLITEIKVDNNVHNITKVSESIL